MQILTPDNLTDVHKMLAAHDSAVPMSGGTDLLVNWPQHFGDRAPTYIDISGVDELRQHEWTDSELILGGRTTYWDLICDDRAWTEFPILIQAARQVGAVQIQTRGTWAGNIANASPAADGVPVLMACDAVVVLGSSRGHEEIPLDQFYLGYKKMQLRSDQLIEKIRIPRQAFSRQIFEKVGSRRAQAIAKIGLAITHGDRGWRVVAASMAPTIRRCPAIENMLTEHGPAQSPDDYLPAIDADVQPIDDIRSTAEYRRHVMARVLHAALADGNNEASP